MNALAHVALVLTGLAALVATFLYLVERATFPVIEDEVNQ